MADDKTNPEPAPAKLVAPLRKKKAMRAYLVLGTLATAVIAIYFIHGYVTRNQVSTDDAQVDADVVPVSARVAGIVLKMEVSDNQEVKEGQLIASIDPADYTARYDAAKADLEAATAQAESADAQAEVVRSTSKGGLSSARAQLQGTGASVHAAESQVAAAAASVARAKSELTKAEGDFARAKKLHDEGVITGQQFETAQTARDTAAAALDQANANLASARDQATLSQSRVAEAQGRVEQSAPIDQQVTAALASAKLAHARVDAAKAALELARLSKEYTKIVAPADGYVSKLAVHDGQMVQPGTMICMVIPHRTYVVANFKETQISRIQPGDEVEIEVDAKGGKRHGKVVSVAAGTGARFSMMPPDNATGNFVKVVQRVPVKIEWATPEDGKGLQAGLSADVTVHLR
jgi:membrane fusion protein (multidrug efflux system)